MFFTGLSFFSDALWGHYIVGLPVIFILIFSIATASLTGFRKYRPVILAAMCLYLLFLLRPQEIITRYTAPMWVGDASVYRNQIEILDYVYEKAEKKQFNYLVYTPAVHDYPYRYLFTWYGKRAYNYSPTPETQPLLFVIIEPDTGYEERQREWLRIREGEGRIVEVKKFPSGITVQTRRRH